MRDAFEGLFLFWTLKGARVPPGRLVSKKGMARWQGRRLGRVERVAGRKGAGGARWMDGRKKGVKDPR